jgi:protein required for attachment to host cells
MRVPHNSLVVVADGRKMLFLRNEGDSNYPNLEVISAQEQKNPADRDHKSDAPGRTFSGQGTGGRSAYEETDFHSLEEARFAADAAEMLRTHALQDNYDQFIIVAPPTTLGELRKHYHKEVQNRIAAELAKDLTNHPVDQIEKILAEQN